jgi:hypothetical protein
MPCCLRDAARGFAAEPAPAGLAVRSIKDSKAGATFAAVGEALRYASAMPARLPVARSTRGARRLRWAALALLAVAGVAVADAGDGTPYAALYRVLAAAREVESEPLLRAVQRIESKRPGVRPDQIEVVIAARAGRIVVPIGVDGSAAFPLRDDLLAENPTVHTNQPRGSLTLSVTLALPTPPSTHVPVPELLAALAAVDAWLQRQAQPGAPPPAHATGVEFRFPRGAPAQVTVRGASERLLVADADGRIVLMREPDLRAGATEIELSQRPLEVLPWMRP